MSSSNEDSRVERPIEFVKGPLVGDVLLSTFKSEMIKERVFQIMFGNKGERIFDDKRPSMNETILPCVLLAWNQETYSSNDVYVEGTVDAMIVLPVKLSGDFNSLRRVASMVQRWMGGTMKLFDKVFGLTMFGVGSSYNYTGLAKFDGFTAPVIQVTIPFKFDLQLLTQMASGFDPNAPLDEADVGFLEQVIFQANNAETEDALIQEGVLVETGQTN